MVDGRLVEYIKETTAKGFNQEIIKKAIIHSGYSEKAFNEATEEANKTKKPEQPNISTPLNALPAKNLTILIYTIISSTLGFFSMEFIGLGLSNNTILNYILLFALSSGWAFFAYLMLKKIVHGNLINFGYLIQLGPILDILFNDRIAMPALAVIFIAFFFSSTFFIAESS